MVMNIWRGSLVGQALGLLPNGHQFESPQGHWRFTRSLTSGPHGISRGARKLARTSTVIKKKISEQDESPRSFGTKQLELRSVTYNATKGFHFSSLYILQQAPKLSIQGL